MSSLTNFALGILVARSVGAEELGAFALAFATYAILLNVGRSVATQPLVVRHSGPADGEWRRATAAANGSLLVVGAAGALLCGLIAALNGVAIREAFLPLALGLPGLLLQDGWRHAFFAVGRGRAAFLNDSVWAIVMLPVVGFLALTGTSLFWLVFVWGGAATLAGAVGVMQSGIAPSPRAASAWWTEQRDLAIRFTAESMTSVLSTQLVLYLLGIVAGLAAVGTLRAGQLVLGPVNILLQGVLLVAVPEAVAALRTSARHLVRILVIIALSQGTLAMALGVAVLAMPDALGQAILGENWALAESVLLPVALGNVAAALAISMLVGLRALAAAGRSLRATAVGAVLTIVMGTAGAALGGPVGAAWGLSAAAFGALVVWAVELFRGLKPELDRA